jgi:distribution and morphology protein 10
LRFTLSSLATANFATSYQLGTVGIVDGYISYLYSSVKLGHIVAKSERIPLPTILRSYRQLRGLDLRQQSEAANGPLDSQGKNATRFKQSQHTLLYGRLYLPQSLLEGLVIKRLNSALQIQLSAVSEQSLRNGGTVLGLVQYDRGKFGLEGLASTDGGFLGLRGLYNFGGDASSSASPLLPRPAEDCSSQTGDKEKDRIYGRFSAGGELYYGTLNKSGGVSLGARFATLPAHRGTPLTATLTINPLMGNISATYAVVARQYCSLATRMEFNVYSYESEWAVGMELWSKRRLPGMVPELRGDAQPGSVTRTAGDSRSELSATRKGERSFQAKLEWRLDDPDQEVERVTASSAGGHTSTKDDYLGVLKTRLDQNLRIGLLWEGRAQALVFSLGVGIDLRKLGEPFRSLGIEVQYSS